MKTLFLIDGAAGTGKSDLLQYISKRKRRAAFVPKYTTRSMRREELEHKLPLDLHFPEDTFEQFQKRTKEHSFYWYSYGNRELGEQFYGFYAKDVIEAMSKHNIAFVIVRDFDLIQKIKRDFSSIQCVSVFIYSDRDLIVQRLRQDGYDDEAIQFRLSRQPLAWGDYLKYSDKYDEKIVNSSNLSDFELLIEASIRKYSFAPADELVISREERFRLVRPLQGYKQDIEERISRFPYCKNVFLMMKFREGLNTLVYLFIKDILLRHGFNCVRADDPAWDITHNTYNPIAVLCCCKYGIALFDEPELHNEYSPNVVYELGIMHNQGKNCLVVRNSKIESFPFDLVKELYKDYADSLELEKIISQWVRELPDCSSKL